MNATFHTLAGLAAAAVLSSRHQVRGSALFVAAADLPLLAVGFILGVLTHGLLDFAPHSYPIKSPADVALSLALFTTAFVFAKRRNWLLLGVCFLGSISPDLVDLGPAQFNKRLGWSLPVVKCFPWHWPQHSGSIYDGSRGLASFFCHLVLVGTSAGFVYVVRRQLFWPSGKQINTER